jgi:hypothetical protein
MIARGVAEQFESSGDDLPEAVPVAVPDAPIESQTISELRATVAQLTARVAELELPPERWAPLKAAAFDCGVEYETLRSWAVAGLVEARREGARWYVNIVSVRARQRRLGAPPAK